MAPVAKVYFLIKVTKKTNKPWTTVVWRTLWKTNGKELEAHIELSKSLHSAGSLTDVEWDVHPVENGGLDKAKALLSDDTFTWKNGALGISIHSIEVAIKQPGEPQPFGEPKSKAE